MTAIPRKPLGDMTEDETNHFRALANEVIEDAMPGAQGIPPRQQAGMLALWLKVHGRPLLNVHVEYDVDPDAFLDDAMTNAVWFLDNIVVLADAELGAESAQPWRGLARMIKAAGYRKIVQAQFLSLFEHHARHVAKRRVR
jgi:hypothetical protein